jgi:methionyl-tRNA formyltransferase
MKLVFAGTPEFAAVTLGALVAAGHEIAFVLTQPDRPAGRGLKFQPSAVKLLAQAKGLPIRQPAALDDEVAAAVSEVEPEAIIVAAYGLIVPPALLRLPRRGCLNVHASLLPRWRGAAPIQRAILAGDTHTGITIMQMDAGLDTGPILLQEGLAIAADETAGTLHDKLAALGAVLIVRALATRPGPQPQDESRVTYARKLRREEAEIDWHHAAAEIDRQIRALEPVPGAQTQLGGGVVKVRRARVERGTAGAPGTVVGCDASGILVACGRDGLRLTELQRAGGKRLPAADFLAGFRVAAGGFTLAPGAKLGAGNG